MGLPFTLLYIGLLGNVQWNYIKLMVKVNAIH